MNKPQQLRQRQQQQLEFCERVRVETDQIAGQQQRWPEQQPKPILKTNNKKIKTKTIQAAQHKYSP